MTIARILWQDKHNKNFFSYENQNQEPDVDRCIKQSKTQNMKKLIITPMLALAAFAFTTTTYAQKTTMVGGAAMYPQKNIVENAVNSKDHTTLVAAVKAAGLVETLQSPGPFTVFAPTNEAFSMLPAGTVDNLLKPENKAMLTSVLTYHVVAGKLDSRALMEKVKEGHGKAMLKTVQGEDLTVMEKGKKLEIKDTKGNIAMVTIKDVYQSNGVIHVVDKVVMP
jgi:uncharacterized surface protein with fasciclin (FAS1) repeats